LVRQDSQDRANAGSGPTAKLSRQFAEGQECAVNITRRELALGASALALSVALGAATALVDTAHAQSDGLMRPGPLAEMTLGDANAPVTVIEYASMTCSHCADFHVTTYPELKKRYIDTGKVRFIFREFPLDRLAMAAFMLVRCAGPERHFQMIEALFQQQNEWVVQRPQGPLLAIAKKEGISEARFNECLDNKAIQEGIEEVRQRAIKQFDVQSTPTFFINGKIQRGNTTIAEFERLLAPHLKI
jgi:protein-disulfide isomerase